MSAISVQSAPVGEPLPVSTSTNASNEPIVDNSIIPTPSSEKTPKVSLKHVDTDKRKAAREKANEVRRKNAIERRQQRENLAKVQQELADLPVTEEANKRRRILTKLAETVISDEEDDPIDSDVSTSADEDEILKYVTKQVIRKKEKAKATAAQLVANYQMKKMMRSKKLRFHDEEDEDDRINDGEDTQLDTQSRHANVSTTRAYNPQTPHQAQNANTGSISYLPRPGERKLIFM